MRKSTLFAATALIALAGALAVAQKPATTKHQPIPSSPSAGQINQQFGFNQVSELRATPNSIPFLANSPGSGILGGSVATTTGNHARKKRTDVDIDGRRKSPITVAAQPRRLRQSA